ncbi:MAG: TerC family protein [Alphaproteobacteria bacterium]|nr:TerC family protein [Alphaproteobacteria bacterium]
MLFEVSFWLALLEIIGVNIILSGDNALVIALACRELPPRQQKIGIFFGAGAAVVLRIIFSIFIVYLMTVPFLKIVGGVLLFWIAYKLLAPGDEHGEDNIKASGSMMVAIRTVLIADAVMSLDNVIAVAAAAKGNMVLLSLGLVISIPLVVYGAQLMIRLLARFPILITAGAALLGYIAGDVIVTDPALDGWVVGNAAWLHYAAPAGGALLVLAAGKLLAPKSDAHHAAENEEAPSVTPIPVLTEKPTTRR